MLFNSLEFILLFLPVTLAGYYLIGRRNLAKYWLTACSIFFYGWWDYHYVPLLLASILGNYFFAGAMGRSDGALRRGLLVAGLVLNLAILGYFKYVGFFVENLNGALGLSFSVPRVILPLAISFFTFQQVIFLVDNYRGLVRPATAADYGLFVVFFPQLIAGPIVRHGEMMPQFAKRERQRFDWRNLHLGANLFAIGLAKKVLLADSLAPLSDGVFEAAAGGAELTLLGAWGGSVAFGLGIYFDFSGYSDMALGLARMFGIVLPLNFNSPYKAACAIDFWRRWHITLSRFLRDYLYIPLGGGRAGRARRHLNLLVVMLLGGLWHGAGWTFVFWGLLQGLFLMLNHAWRWLWPGATRAPSGPGRVLARCLTLAAVMAAWVPFRADSMATVWRIYRGMFGLNGVSLPSEYQAWPGADWLQGLGLRFADTDLQVLYPLQAGLVIVLLIAALALPNAVALVAERPLEPAAARSTGRESLLFRPGLLNGATVGALVIVILAFLTESRQEFIYFQF